MADPQQSGFDVNAARQAGYSDDEILAHLTQTRNFDVDSALKSGYSQGDIIGYLANSRPSGNSPDQQSAAPKPGFLGSLKAMFAGAPTDPQQQSQTRQMLVSGLTGMPTPNMSPQDQESFQQGKAAGAVSVPLVAGATTVLGTPGAAAALATVGKKWGIDALKTAGKSAIGGAAAHYGWQLYQELRDVYEGK